MTELQISFVFGMVFGAEYFDDPQDETFNIAIHIGCIRLLIIRHTIPNAMA